MTSIVITGIGELVTCDGTGDDGLGIQTGAAVVVNEERIAWTGPARSAPAADRQVDLDGRTLIPGFVDSHSHLVFAGDRGAEFVARMGASVLARPADRRARRRGHGAPDRCPRASPSW